MHWQRTDNTVKFRKGMVLLCGAYKTILWYMKSQLQTIYKKKNKKNKHLDPVTLTFDPWLLTQWPQQQYGCSTHADKHLWQTIYCKIINRNKF